MFRRPNTRNRAERMRFAVDAMPRFAREAMLRGIDGSEIIAGAYVDSRTGGVCPMLAAHRNGGRTDLASFARSWDRFTGAADGPRPATEREIRALRGYLEMSLVAEGTGEESLSRAANRIRAERSAAAAHTESEPTAPEPRPVPALTGERDRGPELRARPFWSWILPTRRYDVYRERIAAASEQFAEQRAAELLDGHQPASEPWPGAERVGASG